jgi:hypothetical protein
MYECTNGRREEWKTGGREEGKKGRREEAVVRMIEDIPRTVLVDVFESW